MRSQYRRDQSWT